MAITPFKTFASGEVLTASDLNSSITTITNNVPAVNEANTWTGIQTYSARIVLNSAAIRFAEGANVASAATANIWGNDGNTVHITGTTTITSLGTAGQAGDWRLVIFDGALTLTHSANLNLPGGANITTAAGDAALVYADTTTQLDVVLYTKADGTAIIGPSLTAANTWSGIQTHSAAVNWGKGGDIASAATTDIGAATGNFVHVTGTTTITALGSVQAGTIRFVRFAGSLLLTHNATSLILPDAANIQTAANDIAGFVSEGSGNWRCLFYIRANRHGSDVASAATIDLDVATGDVVDVTGTTTITAITLADGRTRTVRFTGALTLTNGASLVLPGSANITTAAGDFAVFQGYAAGVVRCVAYTKASGLPLVSTGLVLIQAQTASTSASIDFTTGITSAYDQYVLVITNLVPVNDDVEVWLRVQVGGSFQSGAGYYEYMTLSYGTDLTSRATNSTSATEMVLTSETATYAVGNAAGESFNAVIFFGDPASTAQNKVFSWQGFYRAAAAIGQQCQGGGIVIGSTSAITGVQVLLESGNIASGEFQLFGVQRA